MKPPTISHTVKKGENLTGIAKKYGFPGTAWRSIYNWKYNKPFKKANKDPHVLKPGSVVEVPILSKATLDKAYAALSATIGHYERSLAALDALVKALHATKKALKSGSSSNTEVLGAALESMGKDLVAAGRQYNQCLKDNKGFWAGVVLKTCEKQSKATVAEIGTLTGRIDEIRKSKAATLAMVGVALATAKESRKRVDDTISAMSSVAAHLSGAAADSF